MCGAAVRLAAAVSSRCADLGSLHIRDWDPMTAERIAKSLAASSQTIGRERIEVLDALRGFALFGVVVVNMSVDTIWSEEHVTGTRSPADDIIASGLTMLGAGKFLTIFTFLGLGVFMQIERCKERGTKHAPLLTRRLLVLLVVGLMHYLLVGWTDILHVYAVLGLVLLVIHRFSARALLVTAVAIMVLNVGEPKPLIIMAGEQIADAVRHTPTPAEPELPAPDSPSNKTTADDSLARVVWVYSHGTYGDILEENVRDVFDYLGSFALRWWFGSLLPVMLLGAYIARRRILEHPETHLRFLQLVFGWGLALGLAGSALALLRETLWEEVDVPFYARQLAAASEYVGIRALGFVYASGFVLAARYEWVRNWSAPLAAVGRTAFSNYLLQTVVAVVLFFGVGFGLYGRVNPVLGALIAVVTFAAQSAASVWWLSRFRYGPAEWIWRSLSYARLQPLRR